MINVKGDTALVTDGERRKNLPWAMGGGVGFHDLASK
jgi:hypothetical protein